MSLKLYYDKDANLENLLGRKVAVIGYGSQGHAHALNLKESGIDVVVGLAEGSRSKARAEKDGLKVLHTSEACSWADVIMVLVPDEIQKSLYESDIAPHLSAGKALMFAHGLNIHFGKITPPKDVDVLMVAPKGPGHTVRREFKQGSGVPCLIAVHQDASGNAKDLALAYAKAIGGTKAGVFETNFKEETETDLFGEQAVLCGGMSELIKAGFETLVEAGYSPIMAYFECLHEMKLITDLVFEGGLSNMRYSISNTAEYGDYYTGSKIIDPSVKLRMKEALKTIQTGKFTNDWLAEHESGGANFLKQREEQAAHPIEKLGKEIRSQIKFPNKEVLVQE